MAAKTFVIQSETLGRGVDELGKVLMASFLRLLADAETKPTTIFLLNTGVRLAAPDSPVLDHLKKLEQKGVEILSCSTCIDYFERKDKLAVGKPSTMGNAIQLMLSSDTVTL